MRIALIGVSGAGKTTLGEALAEELDCHLIEHQSEACIHSLGQDGDFHTALAIHCLQWEDEQFCANIDFITDGSAAERVAYSLLDYHVKSVAAEKEVRGQAVMAKIAVEFLSALAINSWSYDHAFYLPLADPVAIPEAPVASSTPATVSPALYETAVDELIPLVLEDLRLDFVTLEGSPEDRLAQALRRVRGDDGTAEALH